MASHAHWGLSVVLAAAWIAFFVWQWRWRGWDAFAAEHKVWGIVARVAVALIVLILILNNF